MQEFIYLDIRGETASFKVPQVYQGFLISLPLPPYSTILGILSRICGKEISPRDCRVAFRYTHEGVGKDLEKYHRWKRLGSGKYTYVKTAVRAREVHYHPRLQILIDNTDLLEEVCTPKQYPTLGRSQDISWIRRAEIVEGEELGKGVVSHTFLKFEDTGRSLITGSLYNIPEYFDYRRNYVRSPMNIRRYLAVGDNSVEAEIPGLFRVKDQTFYLYSWDKN